MKTTLLKFYQKNPVFHKNSLYHNLVQISSLCNDESFGRYVHSSMNFEPLTDRIFETGAYGVPSKSQNPTVLDQGGPSSTQCPNPSCRGSKNSKY